MRSLPPLALCLLAAGAAVAAQAPPAPSIGQHGNPPDYVSVADPARRFPLPMGNRDVTARTFAILLGIDSARGRARLRVEGEPEAREWPVRADAEVWREGWWARLDELPAGDRVWVWFDRDRSHPAAQIVLLADELSEQAFYGPVRLRAVDASAKPSLTLETVRDKVPLVRTVPAAGAVVVREDRVARIESLRVGEAVHVQSTAAGARLVLDPASFERRREARRAALRRRWEREGLPGEVVFVHPERREVEVILDHEGLAWGRALEPGAKVRLRAPGGIPATVRQIRPWRERTQLLLSLQKPREPLPSAGRRVRVRLSQPPAGGDPGPPGLDRPRAKADRVEWLVSLLYCPCTMHDGCAGQLYTLAACDSITNDPCGTAKGFREMIAERIDRGRTDRQILEELRKDWPGTLFQPHLSP